MTSTSPPAPQEQREADSSPIASDPTLCDDFEQTLTGLYGHLDWSEEEKHYLRESGLI